MFRKVLEFFGLGRRRKRANDGSIYPMF